MRPILPGVVGLVVLGLASAGCKHPHELRQENYPLAPGTPREPSRTPPVAWTTTLDRDHPLVGRIWSVGGGRFIEEAYLLSAMRERGGHVLLGEKHDNADHHALQARVLAAMVSGGRKPVVAFEMFDVDDQRAIDTSRREHPRDAASLARAVSWEKSGWPPWEQYAPIAELALRADLPIVATGLPRSRMRALMKPAEASDAGAEPPIDEGIPLTAAQEASLREELRESHCGHLPEARIGGMIRFQRARDASMASALIAAANAAHTKDAVLIAGTGHTRTDRGVGADLAARDHERRVVSIAFAEVEKGRNDPPAYAVRWNTTALPFDFVWFTPRATDEDPCAAFAP
jgi:uncharacterized iron-regulated protein